MQGRRVSNETSPHTYQPGDYGLFEGVWYGMSPDGRLANLANHEVVEHEDGVLTVRSSILVSGGGNEGSWHGYLTAGDWKACDA